MRRLLIISLFLLASPGDCLAQLFSRKDIAIHQGVMTFHNTSLNNSNNANGKISWVTEFDKHFYLSRFYSFNAGVGVGNFKNLDNRFAPFESSNFFRMNTGIVFHLPQSHTAHNLSPNAFNPFFKVAYNFDISDRHYEALGGNRLSSSLRLGIGFVIRINHYVGFMLESSHNQKVALDYRSFFQHTAGIVINLEAPYKPY